MNKKAVLTLLFPLLASTASADFYGFEENLPSGLSLNGKGKLAISSTYYKEGKSSLEWTLKPGDILEIENQKAFRASLKKKNNGIMLWIYNEKPSTNPLVFEFATADGNAGYTFSFGMNYLGWRACWMKYEDMDIVTSDESILNNIAKVTLKRKDDEKKGRIYLDRLTITTDKKINDQVTPDAQLPDNNRSLTRTLWHWCRIWEWEQYETELTPVAASEEAFSTIENRINKFVQTKMKDATGPLKKAINRYKNLNIHREKGVVKGNPLVSNDELNKKAKETSLTDVNDMLYGFAADWYMNANEESKKRFFEVFEFAINQGFAYGSCLGTNHHYGYQIRDIYEACWMMREYLPENKEIHKAIAFWSGLQETRLPYQVGRDELLDSWNTLLMPRLISAMLYEDVNERNVALQGLSRWVSGSVDFTPGTIGGMKTDGTSFHHGGFYPAYSMGAFSTIGNYVEMTRNTPFQLSEVGTERLKLTVNTMLTYTNLGEWTNGICGRHPFDGKLTSGIKRLYESLYDQNINSAPVPNGFFTYNYGALGIHRRNNWMISLKGYNAHVWNAEIYTKDNRYGRYQSYGAVEILNGDFGDRIKNGFSENGWDWNRVPGTTTIHLPIDELESPIAGTQMVRSKNTWSGASAFEAANGLFAISLQESDFKNFTPDFKARKSVFCFDNRVICLGSDISNSNQKYDTETTLFQNGWPADPAKQVVEVLENNGKKAIVDKSGNHYVMPQSENLKFAQQQQESKQNKSRKVTSGYFSSAWIDHGKAPEQAGYEYMILIAPEQVEKRNFMNTDYYQVVQKDATAHIVRDIKTGITGAVYFEDYQSKENDAIVLSATKETFVMYKQNPNGDLTLSVCDPDLNIPEYTYTTKKESQVKEKQIQIAGKYLLKDAVSSVKCTVKGDTTYLTVACREGKPVEINLTINL